jgi:hypothetical protein
VQVGVIARAVVQEQRRGPGLPGRGALLGQLAVGGGEPALAEPGRPLAGDAGQRRVEPLAQLAYQAGKRVGEVAVGAATEAVPLHHRRAPEPSRVAEPGAGLPALCLARQRRRQGDAVAVQAGADRGPAIGGVLVITVGGSGVVEQGCGWVQHGFLAFHCW